MAMTVFAMWCSTRVVPRKLRLSRGNITAPLFARTLKKAGFARLVEHEGTHAPIQEVSTRIDEMVPFCFRKTVSDSST